MRSRAAALLLLSCLVPPPSSPAQVTGRGTEFWACWPRSHLSLETSAELIVMADAATTAEVDGAFSAGPMPVAPGSPWIVPIPEHLRMGADRTVLPVAFRIRSLDPMHPLSVTLRVPVQAEASDDTARLLPLTELGTRYLVSSYPASLPGEPSFYVVVATQDGTTVDAAVPCTGVVDRVTLDRGQAWQVFCNWRDAPNDVSGAEISANAPVAVFAGASDAFVPTHYVSGDFIVEQLAPESSWGTEFLVPPLPKGPRAVPGAHDVVRVMPSAAGTLQVEDGFTISPVILPGRGRPVEIAQVSALRLVADVPVDVQQFATGVEMTDLGDPFMATVPAVSHWGRGVRAWLPPYYSLGSYLTIVTESAATANVRLDGAPVAGWLPLPGGIHSWTMVDAGSPHGEKIVSGSAPLSALAHGYNAEYLPEAGLGRTPGSHGTPAAHAEPPCILVPVIDAPATACLGSSLTLRDGGSTASGCAAWEIRWFENGIEIPGCGFADPPDCALTYRGEATYTLELRCAGDPSCTATVAQRVINQPPPPVLVAPDSAETCAGRPVLLEASAGFLLYAWTSSPVDPGVTPRASALPGLLATPEVDTTYTVTAFDVRGCVSVRSVPVTALPDPLPEALGASLRVTKAPPHAILAWQDLPDPWGGYEVVAHECGVRDWRVACPAAPPDPPALQAAAIRASVAPGEERAIDFGALDRGDLIFYKVRALSACGLRPGPTCNPWPLQVPPCP